MDEGADAVVAGGGAFEDGLDFGAVGEADGGAGGVDGELAGEVASELLFVVEEELLEFADVTEFASVGKFAGGIDGKCVVEGEFLTALGEAFGKFTAFFGAVTFAPAAHDIEIFESEAGRIHFDVASVAAFEGAMFFKLLPDGDGTADVGLDGGKIGRRWRRFLAEDAFHDPCATEDR